MQYARKFAMHTLGCKLNFSESSAIARSLTDKGFERVDFADIADYYIINTCSVTENADKKCRTAIKQALSKAPKAKVVMVGCYAQLKPQEIAEIPGVSAVLGANEKFNVIEHLEKLDDAEHTLVEASEIKEVDFYAEAFSYGERTRSFLKVQDGCDYFCSFCTIPLARGKSRSNSVAKTMELAQKVADTGVKEVVLTGVNIGDFGKTPNGKSRTSETFFDLVQELDKIEGVERWRISSIEPNLLNNDIIEFVSRSNKFMPHFHMPLQSGSDVLLKKMRRKYDTSLYRDRVATIKDLMPHCCIGVDVIVGFPSETEEEFQKTCDFLLDIDVSYLHVFTYSERANTKADSMDEVVPANIRRERSKHLRNISQKKRRHFYEQFVGDTRTALFEATNDDGRMYGFTDNYVKVTTAYNPQLVNQILPVTIKNISPSLQAEIALAEYAKA